MLKTFNIIDKIDKKTDKKVSKTNIDSENENDDKNDDENDNESVNESVNENDDENNNVKKSEKGESGEKCTYDYINKNNLDEKYLTNIKKKSNDFIKNDLKKSICNYKDKKAVLNCSIKSPFYNYKGDYTNNNNKCELYNCPEKFEKKGNKCKLNIENLDNDLIWKKDLKNVCEEKWFDWFLIPNYHLGNGIKKFNKPYPNKEKEHKDNMIECYDSCDNGFVPYVTDKKDESNDYNNICVKKNIKDYGLYGDTPDYCPINAIHLLGQVDYTNMNTDENILKDYYLKVREESKNIDIKNEQSDIDEILKNSNKEIKEKANKYIKYLYDNKHKNYLNDRYYSKLEIQKCNELLTDDNINTAYLKCIKIKENKNYIKNKILPYYYKKDDDNELMKKHIETLNWSCDNCFKENGLFYNDIKNIANRRKDVIKSIDNIKEKDINEKKNKINETFNFSSNNIYYYIYDIFLKSENDNSINNNIYLNYLKKLFYILIFGFILICFYFIAFKITRPMYDKSIYTLSKIFLYLSQIYINLLNYIFTSIDTNNDIKKYLFELIEKINNNI